MTTTLHNGYGIYGNNYGYGKGYGNTYGEGWGAGHCNDSGQGEGISNYNGDGSGSGMGNGSGVGISVFARRADDPLQALTTLTFTSVTNNPIQDTP